MHHVARFSALLFATTLCLAAGCGGGGDTSTGTGGQATTTTDPSGGGGTGGAPSGGGGTGGTASGGGGTGGTASGGGGTGGTTLTSSSTTGMGGGSATDHLLINEIAVAPNEGEIIEIVNPTASQVSLADYYLSDNSTYVDLASGDPWMPVTNNPGTDFLARFPATAVLPAGGILVIAFDAGYEALYGGCPDYYMGLAPLPCGGSDVPTLLPTEMGSITDTSGLSNSREMVILFTWSGDTNDPLQDVDYVTWGDMFEPGTRADKTGLPGYQPDTPPAQQKPAPEPMAVESIERCAPETGETQSGGNGITGHDETSEDLAASFAITAAPTPGQANGCP